MSGDDEPIRLTVPRDGRADVVIGGEISASRRELRLLFADGNVRIDGAVVRKGDQVRAGQEVVIARTLPDRRPTPVAMEIDVLFQDANLVAINKPASLSTHPLVAGETDTAANWLVSRFPETACIGDDEREAGWVHRLDRGTSGVLVAARDRETWLAMRAAFRAGRMQKRYLALVSGHADSGMSTVPLKRQGKRTVAASSEAEALEAETRWILERRIGERSLLAVELITGRMHQIRAHLAIAGFPLCGDPLYGGEPLDIDGHFLHAAALSFEHPVHGTAVHIEAPLPTRRRELLQSLG